MKIATWNVCLGAFNKLNYIDEFIKNEKIDILFVQEAEKPKEMDKDLLTVKDYNLSFDSTKEKARIVCYWRMGIEARVVTATNIEAIALVMDQITVVGIYRPFKLIHHQNHHEYLQEMVNFLKRFEDDTNLVVMGDFNLDYSRRSDRSYNRINLYDAWDDFTTSQAMVQLVDKPTWNRIVQGQLKKSILDHVYVNGTDHNRKIEIYDTNHSDHKAVILTTSATTTTRGHNQIRVRNWKMYSKESLANELQQVNWSQFNYLNAKNHANRLEEVLTRVLEKLVPEMQLRRDEEQYAWSPKIISLKRKKKNLLKKARRTGRADLLERVKNWTRMSDQHSGTKQKEKSAQQFSPIIHLHFGKLSTV